MPSDQRLPAIPAEDLTELNANIVGRIEVTAEYHQEARA